MAQIPGGGDANKKPQEEPAPERRRHNRNSDVRTRWKRRRKRHVGRDSHRLQTPDVSAPPEHEKGSQTRGGRSHRREDIRYRRVQEEVL
ncbi:BnaA04g12370D [Brassica napus]|uniref:BnaA04g12370D protein n=1 Tax=Brassica napus TaxID=3708 RepID=A0A078FSI4_BRANA|nr:BnaA04g12370D [Brassica napus]